MKKQYVVKSTLVALGLCSALGAGWGLTNVHAQPGAGAPKTGKKGGAKKGRAKILKELAQVEAATGPLTDEQKADLTTAIKARDEAMDKARNDYIAAASKVTKMTPEEFSQKMKDARKANGPKKATAAG